MPRKLTAVAAGLILNAGTAFAADMPEFRPVAPALWSWSGIYLGAHVGGGLGTTGFSDPAGPAIYGGEVRTPAGLAGLQVGGNWQVPNTRWVFGFEADASGVSADGTNTCFASSGGLISANCRVRQDAFASLTGRIGFAAGPAGHTLIYAKGGAVYLKQRLDIAVNNPLDSATVLDDNKFGWTVGAGIEQAIAPAWSVKMEYAYAGFGDSAMTTPASFRYVDPVVGYVATPWGSTAASQSAHLVKVGLNINFGGDAKARWDGLDDYHLRGSQREVAAPRGEIEIGGRVWYSSGRFQKDLGATASQDLQNVLVSRLSYQSDAVSGEVFGRVDGLSGLFLKGFAGGGTLFGGKMNDEDWIADAGIPYSNTLSDPVKGSIGYATVDVGYAWWRGAGFKVGGFVGYNYYQDNKSAYGCAQQAGAAALICVPEISNATLAISEDDKWHSLRLGINGVVTLAPGLKLTADAAYLPYVSFSGIDNHPLRTDVANTRSTESGSGQGVQLEAILAYAVTPAFSVGAGGRYWAMWTTSETMSDTFGFGCPCQTLPARTERYGGFLQASYKFDGLTY